MTMRRVLPLVGLLVLLCAVAFGVWRTAAEGALTTPIMRWASDWLGREITAGGGVRIHVGRVTRITAEGLQLANEPWGARPGMLMARSVEIELDTRSLLENTLIVRQVHVEGMDLLLEQDAEGRNNWTLALAREEDPESPAVPLVIERLSLPAARIRYAGPRLERPLDIVLQSAEQTALEDGMLALAVNGSANETPLDLRMRIGTMAGLVAGRDIRFEVDGHVGEVALDAVGRLDALDQPRDTEIRFALRGPDADYLTTQLGVRSLGDGPFSLQGVLAPAPGGTGLRGQLVGQIGGFDILARGYLEPQTDRGLTAVQARVGGPDLSRAGAIAGIAGLPAEPFRLQLDIERRDAAIRIRDGALDLPGARLSAQGSLGENAAVGDTLEFRVEGTDLALLGQWAGVAALPAGSVKLTGVLNRAPSGNLALRASGTTPLGKIAADGALGPAPEFYGTRLKIEASGADFRPLGQLLQITDPPAGAFRAQGRIAWSSTGVALEGAQLAVAGEELRLDGKIARPLQAVGTDVRFTLKGSNFVRVGKSLGLDMQGLPAGVFRIAGRLRRQKAATVLEAVETSLAGATLQLDGALGDAPAFAGTRLQFSAQAPALERFVGLFGDFQPPRGPLRAAGTFERAGARLRLREVQASVAGASGTFSTEFTLPLKTATLGFDVNVSGADLAALLPGVLEASGVGRNFELQARGSYPPGRWSFERLRLKTDAGLVNLSGDFSLTPRFATTGMSLDARTASLRDSGRLFGREWPDQPLDLRARLAGAGVDFDLEELSGSFGGSDFKGRMAVRSRAGARDFDARIDSKVLDLRPFVRNPLGESAATKKPRRGDKTLLIPAARLSLAVFEGYNGKLDLQAEQVLVGEERFADLRLRGTLSPRSLRIESLALGGSAGEITARIELDDGPRGLAAHIAGSASNLALAAIPTGTRGPDASRYRAQFDLRGTGRDLRELAGTLSGQLHLVGRGGRIANSRLMTASDDFLTKLLSSLNPMTTRQPVTPVVCTAYLLRARDGMVTTDPALVMQTTELDIISHGSVDLRTERIDFNFKTAARKGLGVGITQLVNPYVKVTGTLAAPGLTLDPRGAVVNGGAAFATAGLSIVATNAWDRVFREKDPCGAAEAESAGKADAEPATSGRWRKILPVP